MEKRHGHSQLHDRERTKVEKRREDELCPIAVVFNSSRNGAVSSSAVRVG
jgi:hypothetical protein